MRHSLLAIVAASLAFPAAADTIIFKNGTTLEGKVVKQDEVNYEVEVEYGTVLVPVEKVKSVEADTEEMKQERAERAAAAKELIEKMKADGKVRYRGRWVSEEEKAEAEEQAAELKKKRDEARAEAKKKAEEDAKKRKENAEKLAAERRQREAQQQATNNNDGYNDRRGRRNSRRNNRDDRRNGNEYANDNYSRNDRYRNDYNNNYNNGYNNYTQGMNNPNVQNLIRNYSGGGFRR